MLFNPQESIDFQGDTGTICDVYLCQDQKHFTHGKLRWRNNEHRCGSPPNRNVLYKMLSEFESVVKTAAEEYNPAAICQYVIDLAKSYNKVYNEVSILKEENASLRNMRLFLASQTAQTLQRGLKLIGVETVERM